MSKPQSKPAPTRGAFDRAHRIFADNGHSCECGLRRGEWVTCDECRAAETIKTYADAKEAEIVALRDELRGMEIRYLKSEIQGEGLFQSIMKVKWPKSAEKSRLRVEEHRTRLAQLRADAGEGGR